MPEVIVKTIPGLIPDLVMKGSFADALQEVVAETLSVAGTQAELRRDEVEVDFLEFSPFAVRNRIDCAITVTANLYPERDGRADEYAKRIMERLSRKFHVHVLGVYYVWVLLTQGGFRDSRS